MMIVQLFFAFLLLGPIVWGGLNWAKYKEVFAPKGIAYYTTMINSSVLYAIAFNLIFFLQELFLVLGKKALGLKAFLFHNNHTWEGEHPMTSLMQGSGALAIFLIGMICLVIFQFIKNSKSNWKLFVLWLAFHGLVQSLPQVAVAYLEPTTDVGEALVGYLNLSEPFLIILAITSIISIAMVNIWFSRQLLGFVPYDVDLNNPKARFKYIRFIAVGAAFIGSMLLVPFRIPPIGQAITPFIVFVFSIPWIWSSATVSKHIRRNSSSINEKIYWSPIIFLVLLLIFFQLILVPGVEL
jgi:uncharacterized membrane protein YjfL (UPF0719 family)